MAGASRWADDDADKADDVRRKKEKEEKKQLKIAKQKAEHDAAIVHQYQWGCLVHVKIPSRGEDLRWTF